MSRYPMTIEGSDALNDELMHLKKIERPRVVGEIAEARAHGDLKENAEYHAAREAQGFIEGRIMDIEGKLSNQALVKAIMDASEKFEARRKMEKAKQLS